jgi:hypothetical protein
VHKHVNAIAQLWRPGMVHRTEAAAQHTAPASVRQALFDIYDGNHCECQKENTGIKMQAVKYDLAPAWRH